MNNEINRIRQNVDNLIAMENKFPGLFAENLRAFMGQLAEAQHAQWPQYRNHWSGPEWVLVRVNRAVKTKLGKAFEKGELAIAKRDEPTSDPSLSPAARAGLNRPSWTVYSLRNECDTKLSLKAVSPV